MKKPIKTSKDIIIKNLKKEFFIGGRPKNALGKFIFSFSGREPQNRLVALNDISFNASKGDVIGLIGKNGSGKSTLLRIIAGIYSPDCGEVQTQGDVIYLSGFGQGLKPKLTMVDNIFLMGSILGLSQKDIRKALPHIVKFTGLKDYLYTKVYQFSTGMVGRLNFAITYFCLAHRNPSILLLDEAFVSGGDIEFRNKALEMMENLILSNTLVILASHDLNIIRRYCKKTILLDKGKIKKIGETETVCNEYENLFKDPLDPNSKEGVTVVIGVRDRNDYRLVNALKSIRNQDINSRLVKIILIDYSSKKSFIPEYRRLCLKYQAKYIRVNGKKVWNRAHALNIGIKAATTKYILSSDIDIIFEKNFIRIAMDKLDHRPRSLITSKMLDLTGGDITEKTDVVKDYKKLKSKARYRADIEKNKMYFFGKSINMALRIFFLSMRGYDEKYSAWGYEDDDLVRRFLASGLTFVDISKMSSFLHQWHPKYEGIDKKDLKIHKKKNKLYFMKNKCLRRNLKSWGDMN